MSEEWIQGRYRLRAPFPEAEAASDRPSWVPATDLVLGARVRLWLSPSEPAPPGGAGPAAAPRVAHPGCLPVLESGRIERGPPGSVGRRLVVEPEGGPTLAERLDPDADGGAPALPPEELAALGEEALGALLALGALGIAHGAVAPEHLLLTPGGPRLGGLGLVEAGGLAPAASPWAAPELRSGAELDPRADLWSLGACLYAAAAGRRPDPHPLPLRELRPELPAPLLRAVQALLESDPRARAEGASAAREQLAQLAGSARPGLVPARLEPAWVDREPALAAIDEAVEEARTLAAAGRAAREAAPTEPGRACLLLVGPPGAGRSRLLEEAARRAALAGARPLLVRAWPGGDPYAPLREALERVAAGQELAAGPGSDQPAEVACAEVGASGLREALDALGGPLSGETDPRTRHERVARGLRGLAAARPVLLLLDDVQLLAPEAAELVLHLVRGVGVGGSGLSAAGPLALVLTARDDAPAAPLLAALRRPLAPDHRVLALPPLDPAAAADLVGSLRLAPEEAGEVLRLGAGSPLALVELARERARGGGTPAGLQELLRARLQRVSGAARELLEVLGALGRPVPRPSASGLGSAAGEAELLAAGLLLSGPSGLEPPALVRQVVMDDLDPAGLRRAAGRALAALERSGEGGLTSERSARARLALQAGAPGAVEDALRAAEDDPAPEGLLAAALESMEPGPARGPVARRLAQLLRQRGAYAEARRALEAARGELDEAEPWLQAAVELELGELGWAEGDAREAQTWAARGRQRLTGLGGDHAPPVARTQAQLMALEARVAAARSDHAAAGRLLERAREQIERLDPALSARLALEESSALVLALDRARYGRALEQAQAALATLEAAGDLTGVVEAWRTLGNHAWYSGDPELAAQRYQEALRRCEAGGLVAQESGLWNNLGLALRDQGQLRRAEAALERALDAAERLGQAAVTCRALTNLGRVRRGLGDLPGACRSFARAARVARAGGEAVIESAARSELGRARLAMGRVQAAQRSLLRSRRLRAGLGDPGRVAESELELAELWRAAGDVHAALRGTARALALRAALADADGAALAVESLEFVLGRPGGPAALLELARHRPRAVGPAPVREAIVRGQELARVTLRAQAALLAARAGDLVQARAQLGRAARRAARLEQGALAGPVLYLARALVREAEAGLLLAEGRQDQARARLLEAIEAADAPRQVRRGALRLRLAFLELLRGQPGAALEAALAQRDPLLVVPPLSERRAAARAIVAAHAARLARGESRAPASGAPPVGAPALSLPEAEEIARRLGDAALLAAVAQARAAEAAQAGEAREAAWQRAAGRLAAERLARGLPESLERGLLRAAAPAGEEASRGPRDAGEAEQLLPLVTRVLQAGPEPERVLGAVLDAAREAAGARRGCLAVLEGEQAHVRVQRGIDPQELAEDRPLRQLLDGAARGGRGLLVPDSARERRFGRLAAGSLLVTPARGERGRPVALILLDHPERGRLGLEQRALVQALADRVGPALESALRGAQQAGELLRMAEAYKETARELGGGAGERELVGNSPGLRVVQRLVERYGRTPAPVTIHGESGTGKELVARALHRSSPRADGPFVALNCAAVSESLLESELFGAVKGAYTGADKDRPGLFELAHQGSLFLDEVGDMSLEMQAKLLRVLETGELRPVGGRRLIKVDVRIISASHRDLRAMVGEGSFREDLFYRLNVLRIELPPLRERREDLPLLAGHFLAEHARARQEAEKELTPGAMELLLRHSFPGNVRELKNVLERACVLEPGRTIGPERLLLEAPAAPPPPSAALAGGPAYQKTYEWQGVPLNRRQRQLLDHLAQGGQAGAAITNRDYCALLGVSERTGLRDLTELVDQGILTRMGKRKGARYRLPGPSDGHVARADPRG